MEQNFQTSFMPKKPMIEERATASRPVGIFTIISIFIFFVMLLASGGLYFYKGVEAKKLAQMDSDLNIAKNRFEKTKLEQLKALDKRLRASSDVLNKHIAITPIFKVLEGVTMKTVRYTKFSYDLGTEKDSRVVFKLGGQAVGYRSIALQSDLLTKNKQLQDPVFSNLTLDEKGNVLFDLEFSVDPSFVDYQQELKEQSAAPAQVIESSPIEAAPVAPMVIPTN